MNKNLITYARVMRFLHAIDSLAARGLEDNAPVVLQPIALKMLSKIAADANQLMQSVTIREEAVYVNAISDTLMEIAEMQDQVERQDESKPAHT